jgi:cobalt-zinc-cadmium efflux system outer membrane protein
MFVRRAFPWIHGAQLAKRGDNEMTHARATRMAIALMCLTGFLAMPGPAGAQAIPAPAPLPMQLSLEQSLQVLRTRGLDLLIAETQVHSAEGDVGVAGAVPNPSLSLTYGRVFTYNPAVPGGPKGMDSGADCSNSKAFCDLNLYAAGITDQAAIEDSLSGKRDLRLKVARNALAAAKMSRVDAARTIAFQVKSAYVQVAQAVLATKFAKEVADSNAKTLELFETRFRGGAINQGDVARIKAQKLEADQALDSAVQMLRQARVAVAFLIGVRGEVPDFDVDTKVLDYAVPPALNSVTEVGLLRIGFDNRPDLVSLGYQKASAEAQVQLARRQKFPDIALGINYAWGGYGGQSTNGPLQTPTITFGLSAPLPVFYQLQGELRQAEAQYDTNSLQQAKTVAQVVNDVDTGYAAFVAAQKLVVRMEQGGLLESAKIARDMTRLQYEKGAATLTDFLDALRVYIATKVEYFQDLTNYWTAVFQLEEAVGRELR